MSCNLTDEQRIRIAHKHYQKAVQMLREAGLLLETLQYPADEHKTLPESVGETIRAVEGVRWRLGGMVYKLDDDARARMLRVMENNRAAVEAEQARVANERRISEALTEKLRIKEERRKARTSDTVPPSLT